MVCLSLWAMTWAARSGASQPQLLAVESVGGLLAFCGATPIIEMCYSEDSDHPGDHLQEDYFGMWSLPWEGYVEFMLPYGAWIRLFRAHGFMIDDLVELRPTPDAVSTYRDETDREWYRRWPGEMIWKVRKEG